MQKMTPEELEKQIPLWRVHKLFSARGYTECPEWREENLWTDTKQRFVATWTGGAVDVVLDAFVFEGEITDVGIWTGPDSGAEWPLRKTNRTARDVAMSAAVFVCVMLSN